MRWPPVVLLFPLSLFILGSEMETVQLHSLLQTMVHTHFAQHITVAQFDVVLVLANASATCILRLLCLMQCKKL